MDSRSIERVNSCGSPNSCCASHDMMYPISRLSTNSHKYFKQIRLEGQVLLFDNITGTSWRHRYIRDVFSFINLLPLTLSQLLCLERKSLATEGRKPNPKIVALPHFRPGYSQCILLSRVHQSTAEQDRGLECLLSIDSHFLSSIM